MAGLGRGCRVQQPQLAANDSMCTPLLLCSGAWHLSLTPQSPIMPMCTACVPHACCPAAAALPAQGHAARVPAHWAGLAGHALPQATQWWVGGPVGAAMEGGRGSGCAGSHLGLSHSCALSPNLLIRPSIPCTRRHCVKPAAAADMFLSLPCSASRCLPPLPSSGRRCLQASLLTRWGWARQSRPSPCWRTWPAKSEPAAAAAAAAAVLQLLLLLLLCHLAAS